MPRTPDRQPGASDEEKIVLESQALEPAANGELVYKTGVGFRFFEEGVVKGLTGSGISESAHRTLRQLIHFIDEGPAEGFVSGAFHETLPATPFPTSFIWWTSAAKTHKIVELTLTLNANKTPATEEWKMYDTDGTTVLVTVTDTISYSGIFETTRTRAIV